MKIDKIIFSVDDNPHYQGLWRVNSEICKKVLGITPILFHITDEESGFYEDEFGIVKKIKRLPNQDTGFQAQIYRMYGTKYFPNEVCLISDIDMLIIEKSYLVDQVDHFSNDDMVIYISDAYDNKREECVGIYSEPRIPMCYNAAKGQTFDEIINTNRTFEEFTNEVCLVSEDVHDRDEIFFGSKLYDFKDQSRIKRLKRGFKTPFVCSKRNDRPSNENFFNNYNKQDIKNGNVVDMHLSRPYSKHKIEIDELRRVIFDEEDEVYLIGCHIENQIQESYLRELTSNLIENNKKFLLVSHTLIPSDIIEKSVGFVYDSINPKYKTWELDGFYKFVFENEFFKLESPYISYGASNYYHVGVIRLLINGIRFLQKTNYKVVHWIEYDSIPNYEVNKKNKKDLKENDFVFFGVGSRFSFNLEKVNPLFLQMDDDQILKNLKDKSYLAERLISENLILGNKKTYYYDESETNSWGRYSQNFNTIKVNWSLFDHENKIKMFIHNITDKTQNLKIKINDRNFEFVSLPHNWSIFDLSDKEDVGYFEISNEEGVIVRSDLSNKTNYDYIIGKVNFIPK